MKKLKNIVLTFVLMFTMVCVVSAEEQYSIDVEAETGSAGSGLKMPFNGITDYEAAYDGELQYYIKFVNESDAKPADITHDEIREEDKELGDITAYHGVMVGYDSENQTYSSNVYIKPDWYMLKGYTKAYVIKCTKNDETYKMECEVLDNPIILEKPALPPLTQRYQYYLDSDNNSLGVFPLFPRLGENGSHELNVKIGLINDENLLKKLAKSESGSLESLMSYAKTHDGTTYTFNDEDYSDIDTKNLKVVNGAYYYIYSYYTNEDGLYRNLDDITIAMGDHNWLVNDVDWSQYQTTDEVWEKFVEKYKQSDLVKEYNAEETTVEITHTDSSLKVIYNDGEKDWITNFKHENGILTYEPSKNEESMIIESEWVANAVLVLADLYKYDLEKVKPFLQKNDDNKYTIAKEGIEFKFITIEQKTEEEGVTLTSEAFSSFKMDIKNGLKLSDSPEKTPDKEEAKKENNVKNPSTGLTGYGVLALIVLIGGIGYLLIRKQSKFPKHN